MKLEFSSFIVLLAAISVPCMTKASNISILVSLPLHQISGPRMSWERGFEILPGAHVAVSGINNDSAILHGHNLQLMVVDSGRDENDIVQQFLNLTFRQMYLNIVGISGIMDPNTASLLTPLARHKGVLFSVITHTDQLDIPVLDYCNSGAFFSLPSPSAMASVLLNFMREMNWRRIGLITDSTDAYFFGVAEILLQVAKTNDSIIVSPYVELFHVTSAIREIIKLNTRVILVSVNAEKPIQLLCAVHEKGLVWPEYAWIFHSFQIEDVLDQQPILCDIKKVVNGIFLIDSQPWSDPSQTKLISGITFSNYYRQYLLSLSETVLKHNITLRPNGYAKLLYDLVWTMAITLNKSCHQNATCNYHDDSSAVQDLESYQEHNNWIFNIIHVRMPRPVLVSTVHYSNLSIVATSFNVTILETAPRGDLQIVVENLPLAYIVIVGFQITLMTIFVTLTLVLYIYFHKEPEIKATSFTLSLLMFAGCYLNLLYLSLLFYSNQKVYSIDIVRDNALCLSLQWLSAAPGISLPLMLATLLMKMLRIYHIFHNTKLQRLGRYCSDLTLAFYVLLILAPDLLVNLLWALVDRYQIHFEYRMRNGYIHLEKDCTSKYKEIFGVLTILYLLALILALAIVAIITRKVRLQHFKDTKKVNILLFIFFSGLIIVFSYWLLLQSLDTKPYIKKLPLNIGHSVLVISFLSLLFVPKVFPPLWRRIKDK